MSGNRPGVRRRWGGTGLALLLFLFCGIPAANASAPQQDTAPDAPPAGVEIHASAKPQRATVGDPIRIELNIVTPEGYTVKAPSLPAQLGDFSLLQVYPGPTVPETEGNPSASSPAERPGNAHGYRARIVVAVYKPGAYSFPPVAFELRDPNGKSLTLRSEQVRIEIQSVLAGKDQDLKDLKNQAEIPEPVRWVLWLTVGLVLLIASGALWWFLHRRRRRTAPGRPIQAGLDPLQLAESELRDLLGRGLLESGLVKKFYVLLADIAKKILEAGYGIHTAEKTTAEVLYEMNAVQPVREGEMERAGSFLIACDLVKFAKYLPSQVENDLAVRRAFEILDACKNARLPLPVSTLDSGKS